MKQRSKLDKLWLAHHVYGNGNNCYAAWLLVRDPMAGRKAVYTVYRISLSADKDARVIGRELPLSDARKIVRDDRDSLR